MAWMGMHSALADILEAEPGRIEALTQFKEDSI
jgi:hypothetical protein